MEPQRVKRSGNGGHHLWYLDSRAGNSDVPSVDPPNTGGDNAINRQIGTTSYRRPESVFGVTNVLKHETEKEHLNF